MKILSYILALFLCFSPVTAQEFRIDFSNEGMKLLKKKGFGKKTIYTNGKDEKGYYLKSLFLKVLFFNKSKINAKFIKESGAGTNREIAAKIHIGCSQW